jgi:hypothetical protein
MLGACLHELPSPLKGDIVSVLFVVHSCQGDLGVGEDVTLDWDVKKWERGH